MARNNSVLIQSFSPFPSLSLSAPPESQISDLFSLISDKYPSFPVSLSSSLTFSTHSGHVPPVTSLVSELKSRHVEEDLITLRLTPNVLGGKGGFGSQLRAAGGRMSSQKTNNNDSCRDLNGRRLSTLKEAKKLAAYIEQEPQRLAAKAEAQRQKLENLERKLGLDPGSSSKTTDPNAPSEPVAGKKHRFDDTEYLEKTEELKDNVKSAVAAALLKKKKAKLTHNGENGSSSSKKQEKIKAEEQETIAKKEEAKSSLISALPLNPVPAAVVSEAIGA